MRTTQRIAGALLALASLTPLVTTSETSAPAPSPGPGGVIQTMKDYLAAVDASEVEAQLRTAPKPCPRGLHTGAGCAVTLPALAALPVRPALAAGFTFRPATTLHPRDILRQPPTAPPRRV